MSNLHFDTLIIGAGLSGIGTACHLMDEFPNRNLAILERRECMGGTWVLFRYPGIRSDSDMLSYGYKFRLWDSPKVLADGARSGATSRTRQSSTALPTRSITASGPSVRTGAASSACGN